MVLLGGVYFCVYQVLYNVAFVYTTAAHGSMIGSTLALMTMVVAALFGVERLSRTQDRGRARGNRRRRRGAGGRPEAGTGGSMARRPHHARRNLLLGLLQHLVTPIHRPIFAVDIPHRRNGRRCRCPAHDRDLARRPWLRRGIRAGAVDRGRHTRRWLPLRSRSGSGSSRSTAHHRPAWRAPWRCTQSAPRSLRQSSSANRSG